MIKGYKVFNPDWTCRDKQYTCPGIFEESVKLSMCDAGMHFCINLIDCFSYYNFSPKNKVAEVIALGEVIQRKDKCCTDMLQIVRELSWEEVLQLVNTGSDCTGIGNTGRRNTGAWNSGNFNAGNCNTGNCNIGDGNVGTWNAGEYNVGDSNSGSYNVGSYNTGDYNIGCNNKGNFNSGGWNACSYSFGFFNTKENNCKIWLFNKPTDWTFTDFITSTAAIILNRMPDKELERVPYKEMTEKEKKLYPNLKEGDLYLRLSDDTAGVNKWWQDLTDDAKEEIMSLPNFDKEIFKRVTGIDIDLKEEK